MERHIQIFLNKISVGFIATASFILLILLFQNPDTCVPPDKPHLKFPKSTCDAFHREIVSIERKNKRLWSTKEWQKKVTSYIQFFRGMQNLDLLKNHSKVLCVSAGAGHEVMALSKMGVDDVTGIELIDSPPLVSRADPHNLPFFDDAFDLAFSAHWAEALFPSRFALEMERTVRSGGICLLVVDECGNDEVREIAGLFRNSELVNSKNVTLIGTRMTRIILKRRQLS